MNIFLSSKSLIRLFIIPFLLSGCVKTPATHNKRETQSQGKVKATKTLKQGVEIIRNKEGQILEKRHYKNNKLEGALVRFYPSGKLRSKGLCKRGLHHGEWTIYRSIQIDHQERQERATGAYLRGKKEGIWVYTYEKSKKVRQIEYKEGKQSGQWTEYDEEGLISKGQYGQKKSKPKKDMVEGERSIGTLLDKGVTLGHGIGNNGSRVESCYNLYTDTIPLVKQGVWVGYHRDGKTIRFKKTYTQAGVITSIIEYDLDGNEKSQSL